MGVVTVRGLIAAPLIFGPQRPVSVTVSAGWMARSEATVMGLHEGQLPALSDGQFAASWHGGDGNVDGCNCCY